MPIPASVMSVDRVVSSRIVVGKTYSFSPVRRTSKGAIDCCRPRPIFVAAKERHVNRGRRTLLLRTDRVGDGVEHLAECAHVNMYISTVFPPKEVWPPLASDSCVFV